MSTNINKMKLEQYEKVGKMNLKRIEHNGWLLRDGNRKGNGFGEE